MSTHPEDRFVDTLDLHGSRYSSVCGLAQRCRTRAKPWRLEPPVERPNRSNDLGGLTPLNDENDGGSEWMANLVSGYGRCRVDCGSIVNARMLPTARTGHGPRLQSLNLHMTRSAPRPLPTLITYFGATLASFNILLQDDVEWDEFQVRTLVRECLVLRFLSLHRVTFGPMDPDSTRIAPTNAGQNPSPYGNHKHACPNIHLREFRFIFDDIDDDLYLPDDNGIETFTPLLAYNQTLAFAKIALEKPFTSSMVVACRRLRHPRPKKRVERDVWHPIREPRSHGKASVEISVADESNSADHLGRPHRGDAGTDEDSNVS